MIKPNFFLIGAPKCGTTAFSEYLRSHPDIFMTVPKAPHYFSTDLPYFRVVTQLEDYLELFKKRESQLIIGEASTSYTFSTVALDNLYQFNKDAKLLMMVRNPINMAYSLYSEHFLQACENQDSFEKAWNLQEKRKKGIILPPLEPLAVQYGEVCSLGGQLERIYSIFPRKQVKVVIFDDLVASTVDVYKDVLSFLKIDYDGRIEFPKVNENKIRRIKWLNVFLQKPPKIISNSLNHWRFVRKIKNSILEDIHKINSVKVKRTPISDDFRKELADYFRDDVKKLSKLLDRDLMYWID